MRQLSGRTSSRLSSEEMDGEESAPAVATYRCHSFDIFDVRNHLLDQLQTEIDDTRHAVLNSYHLAGQVT